MMSRVDSVTNRVSERALNVGGASPAIRIDRLTHEYPSAPSKSRGKNQPLPEEKNLSKGRSPGPSRPALDGVSLQVQAGEIFGILGPNGGGKTTLFKILSTLLRSTSGTVEIFGVDLLTNPRLIREQLGVVFQMPSLDVKLTAYENLLHQGHLYGIRGAELSERIVRQLRVVGLVDRQHEPVERFSGGMRRRVELAKAFMHHPPLLLLDEPSTGLDPGARRDVWAYLTQLRDQHSVTVVLTTHIMDEADRCDRLAVMHQGRLVATGSPDELKSQIGGDVIWIEPGDGQGEDLCRQIAERFGPWPVGMTPGLIEGKIRLDKPDGATFVAALGAAFPGRFNRITVGRPTLEDVFTHLTGQPLWDDPLRG
jgi:ABC-2 type transport system ATP-binding protein